MAGDWKAARLGDLVDSNLGKMLDAQKNKGTPSPYLGNSNVRWGSFDLDNLSLMRFEDHEEERYGIRSGDLIVCEGGEPGRCAIWRGQVPGMKIQKALHRVRPKDCLNNYYLFYWFMLAGRTGRLEPFFTGTTIKHLTGKALHELEVPVPPIEEQRAIAHILGTLDDKIELNRRRNQTLEAMARALFKDWFVDFGPVRAKMEGREPYLPTDIWQLFPDRLDDEGKPEGWSIQPLGNFVEILDSRRVPLSGKQRAERPGPYPYHGAAGIMDSIDDYLFEGVHILLGEDGSVVKPNGRPYTQYAWGKFWVNNHAHVLRGKGISNETLLTFLDQCDIAPFVTGAVQPKLSQGNLKAVPFIDAGKSILEKFGDTVSSLYDQLRTTSDESATLAELRDTLLPKLISGELCISDAEKLMERDKSETSEHGENQA